MSRHLAVPAVLAVAAASMSTILGCAAGPDGQGDHDEYAANYCDELLPEAEQQVADHYEQQQPEGGQTERVGASVTGPFGETIEMEIEIETDDHGQPAEPDEPSVVETGLSDLVLNCGTDPMDDRTCAVEVYLDSELIGRGNFQTTGQLPMRCLPAGQRELRIVDLASRQDIHRQVVTIESDREYMAQVVEDGIDADFEIYGESDLTHGFALPVDDSSHGDDATGTSTDSSPQAPPEGARPMSSYDFEDLTARIDDADFSSDKRGLIEDALAHNHFTADQAARLIGRLDSSMDQEELAIELYPRVVDQNQFHVVIDTIDSSISRDNVRDELGL